MNEQTTYSREAEQRRTFSPLSVVGQQVRLTLGRLIAPPIEIDLADACAGTAHAGAQVQRLDRPVRQPGPCAA